MMTSRAIVSAIFTSIVLLISMTCSYGQSARPNAAVDMKPCDKVLFEQAMRAMDNARFAEARTRLETLIENYPDSHYVAPAKFSIASAWYSEGAFKQAETEYRDFITFFPNRPEVKQAKLKIETIEAKHKM